MYEALVEVNVSLIQRHKDATVLKEASLLRGVLNFSETPVPNIALGAEDND